MNNFSNPADEGQQNGDPGGSSEGDLPPVGKYPVKIYDADERTSAKGTPYWRVVFQIESGPHKGVLVYERIIMTEAAVPRAREIFKCLQFDWDSEADIRPADLVGRRCRIQVNHDRFNDADGNPRRGLKIPYAGYSPPADADPEIDLDSQDGAE